MSCDGLDDDFDDHQTQDELKKKTTSQFSLDKEPLSMSARKISENNNNNNNKSARVTHTSGYLVVPKLKFVVLMFRLG